MHIPRLGATYAVPVVEGVALDDLRKGVGHYPETALPGEVGNFAVAGHRATNGEPFARPRRAAEGRRGRGRDQGATWYVYVVDRTKIVQPDRRVEVIAPVPDQPGASRPSALITLTTCNPRWASYERLIVYGAPGEPPAKAAGPPAELRGGGRLCTRWIWRHLPGSLAGGVVLAWC